MPVRTSREVWAIAKRDKASRRPPGLCRVRPSANRFPRGDSCLRWPRPRWVSIDTDDGLRAGQLPCVYLASRSILRGSRTRCRSTTDGPGATSSPRRIPGKQAPMSVPAVVRLHVGDLCGQQHRLHDRDVHIRVAVAQSNRLQDRFQVESPPVVHRELVVPPPFDPGGESRLIRRDPVPREVDDSLRVQGRRCAR